MKRTSQGPHRKRPHMLPPLSTLQGLGTDPMDPLQPPRVLAMDGRLGSPTPRWHRPSAEELELLQENPTDGKPSIRVTPYTDSEGNAAPVKRLDSLRFDLRNDPIFKEDNDLLYKVQRRNSIKTLGLEQKTNPFSSNLTARRNNNLKNINSDVESDQKCQTIKPKGVCEMMQKGYIRPEKPLHLPSRYAPLKPIGKPTLEESNTG